MKMQRINTIVLSVVAGLLAVAEAQAQLYSRGNITWDDGITGGQWSGTSGGPLNQAWTSGNDAVFETTAGTVNVGAGGATVQNITFNVTGYIIQANTLTLTGAPVIAIGSGSATISSVVAGNTGFVKAGGGTLTLGSAAGTYTGPTTVKAGTLVAGNANSVNGVGTNMIYLGDTSGSSNATVQYGSSSSSTYNNKSVVQSGNSGAVALNGSGNINLGGTVTLGTTNSSGKSVTIANVGGSASWFFVLNGVIQDPAGMIPGTAGSVTVGGANLGSVRFSAANTYSGNTRAATNAFQINNALALQNSTLDMNGADSGVVSFSQNSTLGGLTGSRNLDMSGKDLSIGNNGQSTVFSGSLTNGGAMTKIGTGALALAGANSYTGGTTVSAGALLINGDLSTSSNCVVQANASLGGTGTIECAVSVLTGGSVAAGDTNGLGTLTVTNVTFASGSTNLVRIAGFAPGQVSCLSSTNGIISLGGNAALAVDDSAFLGSIAGSVTIVKALGSASIAGQFNGLPQGSSIKSVIRKWTVSYTSTNVTLSAAGSGTVIIIR